MFHHPRQEHRNTRLRPLCVSYRVHVYMRIGAHFRDLTLPINQRAAGSSWLLCTYAQKRWSEVTGTTKIPALPYRLLSEVALFRA